jgi:hypothetical protein
MRLNRVPPPPPKGQFPGARTSIRRTAFAGNEVVPDVEFTEPAHGERCGTSPCAGVAKTFLHDRGPQPLQGARA